MMVRTISSPVRAASFVVALLSSSIVQAQGAEKTVTVVAQNPATNVTVGDYYSQVQIVIGTGFVLPSDDTGRKQLGKAILSALGLDQNTRSLTISAVMANNGQTLPEVSLVTYLFDSRGRVSDIKVANEYLSPRWQLDASSPVRITLNYSYSEKLEVDAKQVSDNISKLIPSGAIVSTLGSTFVEGVAGLAGSVYSAAGSRRATTAATNLLLPYTGAVGSKIITYDLKLPNGTALGVITAKLVVSPSLGRPAKLATEITLADIKATPSDDAGTLAADVGGSKKFFLSELLGTKEFAALTREQNAANVTAHCNTAQTRLQGYALTRLDRNLLLMQTMLNAGLQPGVYNASVNDWLPRCFPSPTDRAFINQSMGYDIALPARLADPVPPRIDPTNWPRNLKDALGCHMRKVTGPWCDRNAPTASATLLGTMADEVKVGVVELASIDTSDIPQGRMWAKAILLDRLRNKVEQFSCYEAGLVLTEMGVPYVLSVEMKNNSITAIEILRASEDVGQCLAR